MVENFTNINKPKESLNSDVQTFFLFVDIGGIIDHHC
jgi:hypothetical protein